MTSVYDLPVRNFIEGKIEAVGLSRLVFFGEELVSFAASCACTSSVEIPIPAARTKISTTIIFRMDIRLPFLIDAVKIDFRPPLLCSSPCFFFEFFLRCRN